MESNHCQSKYYTPTAPAWLFQRPWLHITKPKQWGDSIWVRAISQLRLHHIVLTASVTTSSSSSVLTDYKTIAYWETNGTTGLVESGLENKLITCRSLVSNSIPGGPQLSLAPTSSKSHLLGSSSDPEELDYLDQVCLIRVGANCAELWPLKNWVWDQWCRCRALECDLISQSCD